uniref:Uncharacterized protein n=1 Tax=Aegilops tauschii subsp. strangulata TaxID=200361 RepID=A0A453FS21_AEGTS
MCCVSTWHFYLPVCGGPATSLVCKSAGHILKLSELSWHGLLFHVNAERYAICSLFNFRKVRVTLPEYF